MAPKMHRRTVGTLKDSLPPKTEYIVYLDIRSAQKAVYLSHLDVVSGPGNEKVHLMWALIRSLGLLLAHPLILERALKQKLQEGGQSNSSKAVSKDSEEDGLTALPHQVALTTLDILAAQEGYADIKSSFKMLALLKIIEETRKLGENLLVFSQSLASLNFIENICRQQRMVYQRLDGKTEVNKRQAHVKAFNEGSGQVYLISTTAGGVGLNIYGASRVVIFDFQHSPVHEQQAIGRAYRIGQTKPVIVYWLICDGTFERTLHNQQVFKQQLASRVVDKKDPLPKATSLRQYFTKPQQVMHQDTSGYLGRDVILDTLLLSDEIRQGISSISTTETFEEEDTQKLEADELAAAEELAQQISRKMNPAEDHHTGMASQPLEQVRETPAIFQQDSVVSASVSSPITCHDQAPGPSSASTAASVPGQVITAATMSDSRANSLPAPLAPLNPQSDGGQCRTTSPPPGLQAELGSFPAECESLPIDDRPNSLAQVPSTVSIPPIPTGFPLHRVVDQLHRGGHEYDFHLPRAQGGFGQTQHQHYNADVLSDVNTLHNDLAPRMLPRDDPFIEIGTSDQKRGADKAQSLSRAAIQPGMMPTSADTSQSHSTQMAATDSGRATLPHDMSPVAIGGIQKRPVSNAAGQHHVASRESMQPIGLAPMMSRPSASRDGGMAGFQKDLTTQASFPLKQRVPGLVEKINQHIKGGALLRTRTWNKLKMLIQGRPDRVDAILNGNISPPELAAAGDPKAGLENLLDGRNSVPQSQDDRGLKDPDVGHPF